MKKAFLSILLGIIAFNSFAQKKLALNGYVKQMQSVYVLDPNFNFILTDNLIHNRMNFAYYANDNLTFKAEFRNRMIYGELGKFYEDSLGLSYAPLLDGGNDVFDFSTFIVSNKAFNWHLIMDRAYVEYAKGNWEFRLGRQRINWGINTIYNPNDLFNAMNFLDFDYEERPGSDAVRITNYYGTASSLEFAMKYRDDFKSSTTALLWKTNKVGYDFQTLLAYSNDDIVIGGGWAGYIKQKYGFKGEVSYFMPQTTGQNILVASLGTDFTTDKEWMFMLGALYNQQQTQTGAFIMDFTNTTPPTAKQLSQNEWTAMLMVSKPFNERLAWSSALLGTPENQGIVVMNTFSYSIKDNWDLDFVTQIAGGENPFTGDFGMMMFGNNLRFKYSF